MGEKIHYLQQIVFPLSDPLNTSALLVLGARLHCFLESCVPDGGFVMNAGVEGVRVVSGVGRELCTFCWRRIHR